MKLCSVVARHRELAAALGAPDHINQVNFCGLYPSGAAFIRALMSADPSIGQTEASVRRHIGMFGQITSPLNAGVDDWPTNVLLVRQVNDYGTPAPLDEVRKRRYMVWCEDYTTGPMTLRAALARVEKSRETCPNEHEILPVESES